MLIIKHDDVVHDTIPKLTNTTWWVWFDKSIAVPLTGTQSNNNGIDDYYCHY